jgi:AefR-like transcriptional repressor, C-terminal domain
MTTLINKVFSGIKSMSRRLPENEFHVVDVPDDLAIEIDYNDSPISKHPAEWLVCFVPGLKKQWWHRFTHPRHKHVFAIKMVGDDQWVLVEPWWTRIMVTNLRTDEAVKFLRWGAAGSILRVTERIPGSGSQARGWTNCAVLISLMLGRSYWTWTPHGLYKRLSAENDVERIELDGFLEEKLASMMQTMSEKALGDLSELVELSPEAAFMELGRRISKIMFSPSSLSSYRLAVSEAPRLPSAAGAYFSHGPHQAVGAAKALISHFYARGRFRQCDQERTSRGFLSMLRGNLFQEIALGCRTEPDERDVESRTRSAVEFLLRGATGFANLVEIHNTEESIRFNAPNIDVRKQMAPADIRQSWTLPNQKRTTRHWKPVAQNAIRPLRHEVKTAEQRA